MGIYVDTADLAAIEAALSLPFVAGITTNPVLVADSGRSLFELLTAIRRMTPFILYAQIDRGTSSEMLDQAHRIADTISKPYVIKLPLCPEALTIVPKLEEEEIPTCPTGVANPMQGYVAAKMGASSMAVYVGRIDGFGRDGIEVVEQITAIMRARMMASRILAASIKSLDYLPRLLVLPGVDITLPPRLLHELLDDKVTAEALARFDAVARSK